MVRRALAALAVFLIMLSPSVAMAYSEQIVPHGVRRVGAHPAFLPFNTQAGIDVGVAVMDTGINAFHPDLNVVGGTDCAPPNERATRSTQRPYLDNHGHGTHVAGTIAAKDNTFGVVGVAPGARLYAVRVFNDVGASSAGSMICGLHYILDHADEIDVVNMSFSMSCFPDQYTTPINALRACTVFRSLLQQVIDRGIVVVAAAGNDGRDVATTQPANLPGVITVSNFVDYDGQPGGVGGAPDTSSICSWPVGDDQFFAVRAMHPTYGEGLYAASNYGRAIDIAAPGTCVLSIGEGLGLAYMTGTSMAAPHVAGAVALRLACPNIARESPAEILSWLQGRAEPQPRTFADLDQYPEGILNVRNVCGE